MAVQFVDGFDHYTEILEKWDVQRGGSGVPNIDTTVGRFVNGSFKVGGSSHEGDTVKFLTTDVDELIVGHAMLYPSDCLYDVELAGTGGSPINARMTVNAPDIFLYDTNGTLVATALGVVTAGQWNYIEFRVKSHATLGEVECHVNAILVASATGIDTDGDLISEFFVDSHPTSGTCHLDDLYALDTTGSAPQNTFLGDVRATVLHTNANGSVNTFSPTGATTNFEAVQDALHDGDATFVEAGQIGAAEDYQNQTFADKGISPASIYAVQTVNAAKKTDAGALRYKDEMVIAGTRYDNGDEVLATSGGYKMTTYIRDTDPSDDAAWTETKVAAVGSGFTITFREV